MPFPTQQTFLSQNHNRNQNHHNSRHRRPFRQNRPRASRPGTYLNPHRQYRHFQNRTPQVYNAQFERTMNVMRSNIRMLQDREQWMQRQVNTSREQRRPVQGRLGPMTMPLLQSRSEAGEKAGDVASAGSGGEEGMPRGEAEHDEDDRDEMGEDEKGVGEDFDMVMEA